MLGAGPGLLLEKQTCSRFTVPERGGSNSRVSLARGRGVIGGEVPGQSHRWQNDHHEHKKDVALVNYDQILT